MGNYTPPFEITTDITDLLVKIGIELGRLEDLAQKTITPYLRRSNRIKTIQASLEIEQNTLSLDQVTAVIEGKRVHGLASEIREVKNTFSAYELVEKFIPTSTDELLKAHALLMDGLIDTAGRWRTGAVGVVKGNDVVHMAPPAYKVSYLVAELFAWLNDTSTHPLIASSVVQYELEFIHPFSDGNGRMGRLWQTVILARWNNLFTWLPVETIVRNHQQEYYRVLSMCDKAGSSTQFIEFMLQSVLKGCSGVVGGVGGGAGGGVKTLDERIINLLATSHALLRANNIADQLGCPQRSVERALARLKKNKKISFIGSPRYGHYMLN